MTGPDFKSAQLTLGLNNAQMAAWLGVSLRTVEQWRATGPSKLGARAVMSGLVWATVKNQLEGELTAAKINNDGSNIANAFCEGVIHTYNGVRGAIRSLALDWRE